MTVLKECTPEEIDKVLEGVDFKTPLFHHQKVSVLFCYELLRAGIFSDVGTGKTLSALYASQLKNCKRIFVVCPNSVKYNWQREADKHTEYTSIVLEGTSEEKRVQLMTTDADMVITNYESLRWLLDFKMGTLRGEVLEHFKTFDMFILDEIHKVKNAQAQQSKLCRYIGEQIKHRIGLTGTPIGNSLLDLFNVFLVLDRGETFGRNFYSYRRKYFNRVKKYWADEWNAKPDAEERISEEMKPRVIRYSKEECLDLPERIYEVRDVELSREQKEIIARLSQELIAYIKGKKVNPVKAQALAVKLSQVSGGIFINEGQIIELEKNPKLDELLELIDEIPGKIVVYHRYVGEGRLIEKALKKKKIKYTSLRGEIKDKDKQILDFTNDPKKRIMVAHPASGGTGINLHIASTMVFYSSTYSFLERYQAEGRIHRIGQEDKCLYIDLIGRDGDIEIDEKVYNIVMGKKNVSDCLLALIE